MSYWKVVLSLVSLLLNFVIVVFIFHESLFRLFFTCSGITYLSFETDFCIVYIYVKHTLLWGSSTVKKDLIVRFSCFRVGWCYIKKYLELFVWDFKFTYSFYYQFFWKIYTFQNKMVCYSELYFDIMNFVVYNDFFIFIRLTSIFLFMS